MWDCLSDIVNDDINMCIAALVRLEDVMWRCRNGPAAYLIGRPQPVGNTPTHQVAYKIAATKAGI